VSNSIWRKRLAVWWKRLYLYPAPDPLPHTRLFWVATALVALAVLLFSGFFIVYLTARHDAFMTNAEDLGIMDQAIWNTLHGQMLHQTICNTVNDTNCYSATGITRFAIHFEPVLFPVSLFYLIWPSPKTLQVIQTLVVASGAFPAFWLARLRLRNEWAGVGIALLYLLYPAQQLATFYDFHTVTFTAAFLLFTLYFMYTRRTAWLIVFAILSMACKEEIPAVIAFFGLWSMLFQRRWRSGLVLVLLAIAWIGLEFLVIHLYSPTGRPLLASRYASLGNGPVEIARTLLFHPIDVVKKYVLERNHLFYLRLLLAPAGYLPLLAPWILVLALPSLAINLLSSNPGMYSGLYQYNAEIVPVLIFATIEAIVLMVWVVRWGMARLPLQGRAEGTGNVGGNEHVPIRSQSWATSRWVHAGLLCLLVGYTLLSVIRSDYSRGVMPFSQGFQWPQTNAHTELAQHFIEMIKPAASVSAQSALVPHISHRATVYLFPYGDDRAEYIFLDVTSDIYPFPYSNRYIQEVKRVLLNGSYGIVAAQDGYLLLKRGLASPGLSPSSPPQASTPTENLLPELPSDFCTFVRASSQQVEHPLQVVFTSADGSSRVNLVGLSVAAPSRFSRSAGYMQITTYWQVSTPTAIPLMGLVTVTDARGEEHFVTNEFPAFYWCPSNSWQPGMVLRITSRIFPIRDIPTGLAHVSFVLLPLTQPFSTIMDVQARLPAHVVSAPRTVVPTRTNALQVATLQIVP
jgi:uncharacterized membrane protein